MSILERPTVSSSRRPSAYASKRLSYLLPRPLLPWQRRSTRPVRPGIKPWPTGRAGADAEHAFAVGAMAALWSVAIALVGCEDLAIHEERTARAGTAAAVARAAAEGEGADPVRD